MASKIFASAAAPSSKRKAVPDAVNGAGAKAYSLGTKGTLAQMAVTGVFNDTFYASARGQLDDVKALTEQVDAEFLGRLAVYARNKAYMKDLPAYLCAVLAHRDVGVLAKVFPRVIDNGKMLRNFVQMIRSGEAGRKSLGSRPKKLVAQWLTAANDAQLLSASVGNAPSLADVIRLSHPKAEEASRDAFFAHILGKTVELDALPGVVRDLEKFRSGDSIVLPKAPFELLTSMELSKADWVNVAKNASWTQTRMNLNTFARHGVFDVTPTQMGNKLAKAGVKSPVVEDMVQLVANRLRDPELVAKAKVFPYQLLAAYLNTDDKVPSRIRDALQDAMELAVANVPEFDREVAVLVDTSGSMGSAVTGSRPGATSKIRCVDVAGLFASAVLRRNPSANVVPFDTKIHQARLNGRDSVISNATKLAAFGGGGTNCGAAMKHLNDVKSNAELVIYVSDNESWMDNGHNYRKTEVMAQWDVYKKRVPSAKLVCIDITPNGTSQAKERKDILNVGGFSDEVFNIVNLFARGELGGQHWVGEIEKIAL